MTWYVLAPPGVVVEVVHADVEMPVLLPEGKVESYAKYVQAAKAFRDLGIEPPPFDNPPPKPLFDEHGVVGHIEPPPSEVVHRTPGMHVFICRCGAAFDSTDKPRYTAHIRGCSVHGQWKTLDGNAEPGQMQWDGSDVEGVR